MYKEIEKIIGKVRYRNKLVGDNEHSHHHHNGSIEVNDYMTVVVEYRKTFATKQDVIEKKPDPSVKEMILQLNTMYFWIIWNML